MYSMQAQFPSPSVNHLFLDSFLAEISTMLPSALFCLLTLVSGHLLTDDRKRPMKGESEEGKKAQTRIKSRQNRSVASQDNPECQESTSSGGSYLGRMNVTSSGRTCQVWRAQQPHEHDFTEVGDHNYCRFQYENMKYEI